MDIEYIWLLSCKDAWSKDAWMGQREKNQGIRVSVPKKELLRFSSPLLNHNFESLKCEDHQS